eukprot:1736673-Prymnesium_polylepis.1
MAGHGRILLNMTAIWAQWAQVLLLARHEVQPVGHERGGAEAPRHRRPPFPPNDVDASIDQLLAANAANEGLVLPDHFMSALIVLKLPSACDVISK